jgi:spore coat protein CotH
MKPGREIKPLYFSRVNSIPLEPKIVMKKILFLLCFIPLYFSTGTYGQGFYAIDTIQKIEILFSQANWDYILDTAKQGSDSYTLTQWVKINGVQFDSAGVKYKGNSSYNPTNLKNPLHIELDHFRSQDYLGYKDIKLSNGFHEPSCIREVLLYSIIQNYMKAPRANFAQVYINGQLMGLYTNTEAVTNTFLDDRFYSKNNTFVFADNGGCDLRYKGNDSLLYNVPYTLKSDYGLADLMHLCDTLNNHTGAIENILDVDRTLWMLAYTNALVILDSYLGNAKHNYYIYKDHNGRFNPIIWDLNGGLGIFNRLYPGPGLSTLQMQTLTPMAHSNDSLWPLVKNILAEPVYKRMYIAHMKQLFRKILTMEVISLLPRICN